MLSIAYTNIQHIFFLHHQDPQQFYLMLQLADRQSALINGVDTNYSNVVLQMEGMGKTGLELSSAYTPIVPEEVLLALQHHKWERYEALVRTLQWLCQRQLTVSSHYAE